MMTSRERVQKAVDFQKPDRIPMDLGAMRASGINVVVYDELKKRLGISTPTKVQDTMLMLAEVEIEVLNKLHCDVVPLDTVGLDWAGEPAESGVQRHLFCGKDVWFPRKPVIVEDKDGSWLLLNDAGKAYATMPHDGFYFDFLRPTMSSCRIDPDKFLPADTVPDATLAFMEKRSRYLYENTDKAIVGWGACLSVLGLSALLADNITQGSLDEWLCMLLTEQETAHEMMGRYVDATIKKMELFHQAVGDRCFAWGVISDDGGTQKNSLISPDLFSEMIKPHYKRVCDWVHQHTNWKTFLHSCGSVYNYIPHWIEAGVDIFNPVQISAEGMAPERLMKEFGGKIVFWGGGCDTQHILPLGSREEIRNHVKENLSIFDGGQGGYVFNQVHNIQQNVPVENLETMYQAAFEFSQ